MQWEQLALIAFGVVLTLTVDRLKSRWDSRRETNERRDRILSIMATLVLEIEDGIAHLAMLAELLETSTISIGRIYTGWWTLVGPKVADWVKDPEMLKLVNRIYHRFDLVNLNVGSTEEQRTQAVYEFAEEHLAGMTADLASLKEKLESEVGDWVH